MNELAIVETLRKMALNGPQITLGIGDDCAIFRPRTGEDLLLTTDQMIEDVHFTRKQSASAIGERALARSLSDIASMGGDPRFCLVTLAAPADEKWIISFYQGLLRLAKRHKVSLAGGDLARDEKIHCDVMVCGAVPKGEALRRDGAGDGDEIYVSGRLGKPWDRRIEPRLELGKALRGVATACIDLSDGLSMDLHRLCVASMVSAEIDRVPIVRGASLERALHGGEDYELLFTLPRGTKIPRGVTKIGKIRPGTAWEIRFQGRELKPQGYDHFRKSS